MRSGQNRERQKKRAHFFPLAFASIFLTVKAIQSVAAAGTPALPDPVMTPGEVNPAVTTTIVCAHDTKARRRVSASVREQVLFGYNVPLEQGYKYEIDHLIPLALGGANTAANLWPQPMAEAVQKDALEVEMQRLVCHGILPLDQAQHEIADDWAAAYRRYVDRP